MWEIQIWDSGSRPETDKSPILWIIDPTRLNPLSQQSIPTLSEQTRSNLSKQNRQGLLCNNSCVYNRLSRSRKCLLFSHRTGEHRHKSFKYHLVISRVLGKMTSRQLVDLCLSHAFACHIAVFKAEQRPKKQRCTGVVYAKKMFASIRQVALHAVLRPWHWHWHWRYLSK